MNFATLAKPAPTQTREEAATLLLAQTRAVLEGERDWLANLSQFTALVNDQLADLNWSGFYMARGRELVLGPFQGKVACVRIPFGRGVCGACATTRQVQIVADVHAFPGHIACDSASRSELVLPVIRDGTLLAVFDLDSPSEGRFDAADARCLEAMLAVLIDGTDWP